MARRSLGFSRASCSAQIGTIRPRSILLIATSFLAILFVGSEVSGETDGEVLRNRRGHQFADSREYGFIALGHPLGFSFDIDQLVDSNNVSFVGLGAITGFVFWWFGIFRNNAFPFVDRRFPISVLSILPIAAAFAHVDRSLEPTFYQGRVISILAAPRANPRAGQASVRLTDGRVVRADLGDTWPTSMVLGRCVEVDNRWSTLRVRRVYEVLGPFGASGDDC